MSNDGVVATSGQDDDNGQYGIGDLLNDSGLAEYSSFNPKTPEGARMLLKATMAKLPSIKSKVKEYLNVVHVFAHDVEAEGDTPGEIERYLRTVVFTEEGDAYDCGSQGVQKSIRTISRIRGLPPWNPPVKCEVILEDIGNKKQWLTLRPDVESLLTNVTTPKR